MALPRRSPERAAARAARKAEVQAIFQREREATVARERRYRLEEHGYQAVDNFGVWVRDDIVIIGEGEFEVHGPLAGAHATLETSGSIGQRVTATRLLAFGVLAAAAPKLVDRRTMYLVVTGDGYEGIVRIDPQQEEQARIFVTRLNTAAMQAAASASDG